GGGVRRGSELGARAGGGGRARRFAAVRGGPDARDGAGAGRDGVRGGRSRAGGSAAPAGQDAPARGARGGAPGPGAGHGAGVLVRPRVRLREGQRRLRVVHVRVVRGRGREGRPPHELQPELQAHARGRGAVLHVPVQGPARGDQVRRRGHGEGLTEGGV